MWYFQHRLKFKESLSGSKVEVSQSKLRNGVESLRVQSQAKSVEPMNQVELAKAKGQDKSTQTEVQDKLDGLSKSSWS